MKCPQCKAKVFKTYIGRHKDGNFMIMDEVAAERYQVFNPIKHDRTLRAYKVYTYKKHECKF